jgi:hypothetical protein
LTNNDSNQIDPAFFNQVAQIAHFFTMYAIMFTIAAFAAWPWVISAFVVCLTYAGWHEFLYDPQNENAATRGSDLQDFLFLVAGAVTGTGAAFLLNYFVR